MLVVFTASPLKVAGLAMALTSRICWICQYICASNGVMGNMHDLLISRTHDEVLCLNAPMLCFPFRLVLFLFASRSMSAPLSIPLCPWFDLVSQSFSFFFFQVSVLTTLERRFNLQSADVGVIASSFEIGNLALILFVSYFGAKAHRPRLIGCGGIVMALGAFLSALPEFLTNQYEVGETWRTDEGRDVCANMSSGAAQEAEDLVCGNKAKTNMMYLLLIGAQVLLGIGATPVQPLGVSYIDDHVKKKDSSLYIGRPYLTSTKLESSRKLFA